MRVALACTFALVALAALAGPVRAQDRVDALMERLERQERELQSLRQEVKELREQVPPPPQHPEYRREDGEETLTDYVNPRIRLDIAGQVNPAMNIAGDGHNTKLYFVDNDTTASRIRFAGVSVFDRGPQLGTTLEVGFSPNNSFDVSQDNELAGSFIDVRRAEVWVRDDRYGRVMLGRGSGAADNTAEYDLSLVSGPIMTSGASFIAGGLQFVANDRLSGVTVADAFFNFDRESREPHPLRLADARSAAALRLGRLQPELRRRDHLGRRLRPLDRQGARGVHDARRAVDLRSEPARHRLPHGRLLVDAAQRERHQRDALERLRRRHPAATLPTTSTASSAGTRDLFDFGRHRLRRSTTPGPRT